MADILALHCKIAALETELRLTKEQLQQHQNGGIQLVNLLGQNNQGTQPTDTSSAQQKEIANLRFQLHDAGERNEELERSLKAVRRAKNVLLNLREKERACATEKNAKEDGNVRFETGYPESCAESLTDGPAVEDSASQVPNYGSRQQWARAQANLNSTDTKSGRADPPPATKYYGERADYFAAAPRSNENNVKEIPTAHQEPKVVTPEEAPIEGIRCEGSNGRVFYITPGSPDETNGMPRGPANGPGHQRTIAQRLRDRFAPHEHNRLAGIACWVEDLEDDEYEPYWRDYAVEHNRHSAAEWRAYYETVIRPVYLEKLAKAKRDENVASWRRYAEDQKRKAEQGAREIFQGGGDAKKGQASPSVDRKGVVEPCLLDMDDFTSSGKCVASTGTGLQSPIIPKARTVEAPRGKHKEPQSEDSGDKKTTDSRTPDVVAKDSRADGIAENNEVGRSEDIQAPTKPSTTGPTTITNPDNVPSQPSVIETGTARPMHIRSYSKEEVKRQKISRQDSKASMCSAQDETPVHTNHQLSASMHAPKHPVVPRPKAPLPGHQLLSRNGTSSDPSLRRTILITGIPTNTPLTTVLDNIQGGRLLRIRYIDTAGMQTRPRIESNTVLVEFIANDDARRFCTSYTKAPMLFLSEGKTHTASVTLIPTASKPIPIFLSRGLREEGWSRALYVHGDISAEEVVGKIARAWEAPKGPVRTSEENGLVTLEYAAVEDAVSAFEVLVQEQAVRGMGVGFLPDPCARVRVVEVGE